MKKMMTAAALAGAMGLPMAATTQAQPLVAAGNLVNVQIVDAVDVDVVLRDINVAVAAAVNIAANVCGIAVGVIAEKVEAGDFSCTGTTGGQDVIVKLTR